MKIGERKYMDDFIENGTMFLSRLKRFRTIEEAERGDKNDGLSYSYQPDEVELSVNGKIIEGVVGPIRTDEGNENPLIYCMYGYNSSHICSEHGKLLDERCYEFGDTAVLIKDGKDFFNRVVSGCKNIDSNVEGRLVSYVDYYSYHGKMGSFKKYEQWHQHQHEFRFVFDNDIKNESYELKIGSIKDIAELYPVDEMNKIIEIKNYA